MRIGIMSRQVMHMRMPLDEIVAEARAADARGLAAFWLPNVFNLDALSVLMLAGRATQRIELGTAVIPAPARHPYALAQQALTTQLACSGRLLLGIGMSHDIVTRGMFGLSFDRPARQMREYLEILMPLLAGERVEASGEFFRARIGLDVPERLDVPVIVAAMGERMLRLAGRLAHGTIPWLAGPKTLEGFIVPTIRAGAEAAGRPAPRVVSALPVVLTDDVDAAREEVNRRFAMYTSIPSYAGMLAREGDARPSDVALVGNASALRAALRRLAGIGVTDLAAVCVPVDPGAEARTLDFLAAEA